MLKIKKIITLNKRGDTIIEVMISMAILGLILGGAYYTANQSLNNIRAANEHSIAINIAQSQIEEIKIYNTNNPKQPFNSVSKNACLGTNLIPLPGSTNSNIVGGNYWCRAPVSNPSKIGSNALSSLTPAPAFYYSINVSWIPYSQTSSSGGHSVNSNFNTYTVTVNWPTSAITGSIRNQVVLNYRSN